MHPWLARLRHDLVERAVGPARALLGIVERGETPSPPARRALRDGLFALHDEDGTLCDARLLWAKLVPLAPGALDEAALDSFGAGVDSAMNVVGHAVPGGGGAASNAVLKDAADAVLALERLFDAVAES